MSDPNNGTGANGAPEISDDGDLLPPLSSGLRRLFTSSKYMLAGITVIGIIVMNVVGRIDGPKALESIVLVVMLAMGATGIEDAMEKFRIKGKLSPRGLTHALNQMMPLIQNIMNAVDAGRRGVPIDLEPMPRPNCSYKVQEGDDLDVWLKTMHIDLGMGHKLIETMNDKPLDELWKPGNTVTLPYELCMYVEQKDELN